MTPALKLIITLVVGFALIALTFWLPRTPIERHFTGEDDK